jgi:hypothetical protein
LKLNRIFSAFVALLLTGAFVQGHAAAAEHRTGYGAFLRYRADSVNALVKQLSANPSVAARYARHFGTTPEALTNYFKNDLKLVTLKSPRRTVIYFVSKDGGVVRSTRLLPAGSRVFIARDGQLILEWRCGNPLAKQLPIPVAKTMPSVTLPVPKVQVASAEPVELGPIPPPTTVLPTIQEVAPLIPVLDPTVGAVAAAPVAVAPASIGWIAAVPALLAAVSAHSSKTVIPEPGSLAVLGMGASGLILGCCRRKIRRLR